MAKPWARAFYKSKEWQTARGEVLRRDGFTCQVCGARAEEVHHIKELSPARMSDETITLALDNLIALCRDCHFKVHEEERKRRTAESNQARGKGDIRDGFQFDEDGNIVPITKDVFIVWGAPASGKTTYVAEHKDKTDIAIDLDKISEALTFHVDDESKTAVLSTSIAVRDYLYAMIEERRIISERIWIVAGLPHKEHRERLAQRLRAKLIHMDADHGECLWRAMADDKRTDKLKQRAMINNYFDRLQV